MANTHVNPELSLKLKKYDFNEPCETYYTDKNTILNHMDGHNNMITCTNSELYTSVSRPTHQAVVEWFISKNCHIQIKPIIIDDIVKFRFEIENMVSSIYVQEGSSFATNTLALEAAFENLINNDSYHEDYEFE